MQLRQLRPLIRSTSTETVKTLVKTCILCRLDYSNSMFYGMTEGLMSQLRYFTVYFVCIMISVFVLNIFGYSVRSVTYETLRKSVDVMSVMSCSSCD